MASDAERRGAYKSCYFKLLDELTRVKYEDPAAYAQVAKVTQNFRTWILEVGEISSLPDVPANN